ncbi:MAG TPA: hypothetical protein VI485_02680 [Vicinamibacterales bacterium]|nr:hypothetical protein [Vicinamibacterales bacterium]
MTKTPAPEAKAPATPTAKAPATPAAKTPATPAAKAPAPKQGAPVPKAQAPKPVASAAPKPVASPAPKSAASPASVAPPVTAASATLDLTALKDQLKQTKAIGLMTKLSLKNQVDDLLDKFREHHSGKATPTMAELRRSYDLLMMKVLSLLQDHDQKLASDIVSSRERIWGLLADPKKFAALEA